MSGQYFQHLLTTWLTGLTWDLTALSTQLNSLYSAFRVIINDILVKSIILLQVKYLNRSSTLVKDIDVYHYALVLKFYYSANGKLQVGFHV